MKIFKSSVKKYFPLKVSLGDFLLKLTPLSHSQLGEVATKGGVWIQRKGKGKVLRIRLLNELIGPEDVVQIFYDPKILKLPEVQDLSPIFECENYGVWPKPVGVVAQGSQPSDHASLMRFVEKYRGKEVFLVHRLDRETAGPIIFAYTNHGAAVLSQLFQNSQIEKIYEAIVLGEMQRGMRQTVNHALDDKKAITHFEVLDSSNGVSLIRVKIETGRFHQIRRHLNSINYPIMGDPKYGKGNKNKQGLQLLASSLSFFDPWLEKKVKFEFDAHLSI